MVYQSKLVACIKVNGKVLREFDNNEVKIPFGSEYSIYLKNLNTRKALVNIEIDGKSIGDSLVLNSDTHVDIERYISLGSSGYKFKFIEKTEQISNHRGDRAEDGIVRIEYQFEEEPPVEIHHHHHYDTYKPWIQPKPLYPHPYDRQSYPIWYVNTTSTNNNFSSELTSTSSNSDDLVHLASFDNDVKSTDNSNNTKYMSGILRSTSMNTDGITVKGNDSDQTFINANIGKLSNKKEVICIKLVGTNYKEAITVKDKIECEICGKVMNIDRNLKFCSSCGNRVIF